MSAAIPPHIICPAKFWDFNPIIIHCKIINNSKNITMQHPINPNSSPMIAKIKSVSASNKKLPFFTEFVVLLFKPFPLNWPEPIAIIEFCSW